ncbi:MAG: hypothetical protein DHS20C08_18320 [Rhodomicrobium sp.]|nr:MAG: hypothetical protein DHS20C08_18320 [Rhodomicrobium sp.]
MINKIIGFRFSNDCFGASALSLFRRPQSRHSSLLALALISTISLTGLTAAFTPALAGEVTVRATYKINAPIGSGKFQFASAQDGKRYKMQGAAKFKAFLGFFKWNSSVASNGYMSSKQPKPYIYAFKARSDEKSEVIRLNFKGNKVKEIRAIPPTRPHPKRVSVRDEHLRNVVDPLSAVMAFTDPNPSLTNGSHACNRKIRIFDGRQRFNVVLSYKRKDYAELSNGKSRTAFVCRAKYTPIAGHKMNQTVKYMSSSKGLEVWLVPLPKMKMYVPYKIVIPIMIGTASAELVNFRVTDPKAGVIALAK